MMGVCRKGVGWTPERNAALIAAWAAGTTAVQIAIDLGGFQHCKDGGKNSVLSRVHTLGLPKRTERKRALDPEERARRIAARSAVKNEKQKAKRRGVPYVAGAVFDAPIVKAPAPPYEPVGISFADLREFRNSEPNQCRYIDAKDMGPNFFYCGSETLPGESLCGHCHAISHAPLQRVATLTAEQREARREQGRHAGYASIKQRGLVMGRAMAAATTPVVDGMAAV